MRITCSFSPDGSSCLGTSSRSRGSGAGVFTALYEQSGRATGFLTRLNVADAGLREWIPQRSSLIFSMHCSGTSRAHRSDDLQHLDRAIRVLEACKNALQNVQIPGISLAIDAALVLVGKLKATKANEEAIARIGAEILSVSRVLEMALRRVQDYLDMYRSHSERRRAMEAQLRAPSPLKQRVEALERELVSLNLQADKLGRRRFLLRCMRSGRDTRVLQEIERGIKDALARFKLDSGITVEALVDDLPRQFAAVQEQISAVQSAIDKVDNEQRAYRDERLLEHLPRVEANYQAVTLAMQDQQINNTSVRVLGELRAWARGDTTLSHWCKPVWILSGPPGSGKSTLASRMCHQLQQENTALLGASFFFDLRQEHLSSTKAFFTTIAYQLARSQPSLYPHIIEALREHVKHGSNSGTMECVAQELILGPLQVMLRLSPTSSSSPVIIVVDALDECVEHAADTLPRMIRLLVACTQVPLSPIRVLLTARPCTLIDDVLDSSAIQGVTYRHSLDRHQETASDVATFLRGNLAGRACSADPAIIDTLAEHAGTSFAYARIITDILLDHPEDPRERLGIVLSLGPPRSHGLYALYSAVMGRAAPLTATTWARMRMRVERPSVFALCDRPACYPYLTGWLCSSRAGMLASGIVPPTALDALCPRCRAIAGNAPIEMWTLKRLAVSLIADGLRPGSVFPEVSQADVCREDPWLPDAKSQAPLVGPLDMIKQPSPRLDPTQEQGLSPNSRSTPSPNLVTVSLPDIKDLGLDILPAPEPLMPQDEMQSTSMARTRSGMGMPVPLVPGREPFIGGFVVQSEAIPAHALSTETTSRMEAQAVADVHLSTADASPVIPTPTAPTSCKPRRPRLRVIIASRNSPPTPLSPSAVLQPFRRRTPVDLRSRPSAILRLAGRAAPRSSPCGRSSRAKNTVTPGAPWILATPVGCHMGGAAPTSHAPHLSTRRTAANTPASCNTKRPNPSPWQQPSPMSRASPRVHHAAVPIVPQLKRSSTF
ncbi:hypothetical protein BV20DRAFT_1004570 [Pilatotrama ljubarskyi]|nr:hypothetical protein BV20DRAFT_1004570 [Pilatotrama ljubarskyi]